MGENVVKLRCIKCGGSVTIQPDQSLGKCMDCDALLPLPSAIKTFSVDDPALTSLLNRYNKAFQYSNEFQFHRAYNVYDKIIKSNPEDFYAYWGKVLAQYGVIYRLDQKLQNQLICLRTQFTRIFDNENYLKACEYADSLAQSIIKKEALEIERCCQESIKTLLYTEPFDAFLLVDDTPQNPNRDYDVMLASELYEKLTEQGLNVLYPKDLLANSNHYQLESTLFSAIELSSVFLVVSSKVSHIETPLIKNTWLRFQGILKEKNPSDRLLAFCYDESKEAFDHQGQDQYFNLQMDSSWDLLFDRIQTVKNYHVEPNLSKENQELMDLIQHSDFDKARLLARERTSHDETDYFAWWISFLAKQECEVETKVQSLPFDIREDFYFQRAYLYAPRAEKLNYYQISLRNREKNSIQQKPNQAKDLEYDQKVEQIQKVHYRNYLIKLIHSVTLPGIVLMLGHLTVSIKSTFSTVIFLVALGLGYFYFMRYYMKIIRLGKAPKQIDGKEAIDKYFQKLRGTLTPTQIADFIPHQKFNRLRQLAHIFIGFMFALTIAFIGKETYLSLKNPNLDYYYIFQTVVITGGRGEFIEIPAEIGNRKVERVSDYAFYRNEKIKRVEIKEGVEELGDLAFADCSNLEMIKLPTTIQKVGKGAPIQNCHPYAKIYYLGDLPLSSLLGVGYDKKMPGLVIESK